jgi:hypothetical protein
LAILLPFLLLPTAVAGESDSRSSFFEGLAALCGSIFEGHSTFPPDPEHPFAGKLLSATIASCSESEIRVPFVVGADRSRTWVLTRSEEGLLLKHDHRHEDGTPDEITMYGGWASDTGSGLSQSFAADDHTKQLLPEASTNVWTLTLAPDGRGLTYYLERHAQPRFEAKLELVARD